MLRSVYLLALFSLVDWCSSQSTPQTDCGLRDLTVDFVAKLQSYSINQPVNQLINQSWASTAFDAMRLGAQCNRKRPTDDQSNNQSINQSINQWDDYVGLFPGGDNVSPVRRQSINQSIKQSRTVPVVCELEVFVDNKQSINQSINQAIKGSFDAPVSTIQEALQIIRISRVVNEPINQSVDYDYPYACITIREGVYYLGDQSTNPSIHQSVDSRRGAIHLTERDSNLSIRAYSSSQSINQSINQSVSQYEKVVLSGGVPVMTDWQPYQDGIYQTKINQPLNSEWAAFNELYIGTDQSINQSNKQSINQSIKRAIRAKAPNGDPSTHGLHSHVTGWQSRVLNWLPARKYSQGVDFFVASPQRDNSTFPDFRVGISGPASQSINQSINQTLPGPASMFTPPFSMWAQSDPVAGDQYTVPTGLVYDSNIQSVKKYKNPETGFVHAFHDGHWGSWVFSIENITQSINKQSINQTILFGRGGHQEARGSERGAEWYIDNLFEELDDSLEWFFDVKTSILYFQPNVTSIDQSINQSINQLMPDLFIASQIPCLISLVGSSINQPINDIRIEGLTFSHTSNTYMSDYRVPSGGDWSIHTGATVYMSNTESINLSINQFTQLGSNAISAYGYNADLLIDSNDFSWLGDSGIVLCGSVDGMDGISSINQPINTLLTSNHFRETGIYIKQSSPIVQFLSRSPTYIGNAMYNMPRAGINVNDGFAGDLLILGNSIFNSVRETSDHGPFNSWDRQPYLTLQTPINQSIDQSINQSIDPQPSLIPALNRIIGNLFFNTYHSVWTIDHDDGSCFYEDSFNLLIYGGYKNYLGHSKSVHDNLYIYPDSPRFDTINQSILNSLKKSTHYKKAKKSKNQSIDESINQSIDESINQSIDESVEAYPDNIPWGFTCAEDSGPQLYASGYAESWYNNECHLATSGLVYYMHDCAIEQLFVTETKNNTIYVPANNPPIIPCTKGGKPVNLTIDQWQDYGQDSKSTWHYEQPFDQLLNKARALMGVVKQSINQSINQSSKDEKNRHRHTKMTKMFD